MLEIIVTFAAFAADQLVKYWAVTSLSASGPISLFGGAFMFLYAENYGDDVSFIRGRSVAMTVVRILQVALILYLLIKHKKKLAPVTRVALCLFMAGLVGNQFNYIAMNYVPDMLYIPSLGAIIFNVADVFVVVAVVILFIRLAFFEGRDLVDWLEKKLSKKKREDAADSNEETAKDDAGVNAENGAESGEHGRDKE